MGRVLSHIGIGGAAVDTILPDTDLAPGETVELTIELEGGDADHEIQGIYFTLLTDVDGDDVTLAELRLDEPFTLAAGESTTTTTDMTLPRSTPVTGGDQAVWLETGLDIDWAVDPTDRDTVDIVPDEHLAALFEALEELGFTPEEVGTARTEWLEDREFVQRFAFAPDPDRWPDLDGLALMPVLRGEDVRVFLEIDEDEDAEHLTDHDYDAQEVTLTLETTNVDMLRRRLKAAIEQHVNV